MATEIQLDLETLGVGADAAVVQIGAVAFDPEKGTVDREGGLRIQVDLNSKNLGKIDGGTVKFWLEQEPEAIKQVLLSGNRVPLEEALVTFDGWVKGQNAQAIWGNAPTFDLTILRSAYARCGMPKFPMSFRQERCFRTLLAIGKSLPGWKSNIQIGIKHDGLDDAIYQAETANAILARIRQ